MDPRCQLVGVRRDDGEGLQPAAVRLLPCVPYAAEGERVAAAQGKRVGLLSLRVQGLPLIEAVRRDEAAATLEGTAPHRLAREGLRLCVDSREALEVGKVLGEVRHHVPPHGHELTLSCLFVGTDDGLERGWRNVVVGWRKYKALRQLAEMERFGDALLIGPAIVTTAPTSSWDESGLYQLGAQGLHLDVYGAACLKVFTNTVHFGLV